MTYNIHPLLVHFPIAFLFVYSVVKILPFKRWFPNVAWNDIERCLLVFGVLGAFAALATGDTAEHSTHSNRQLVEIHSTFAALATWLYGALLAGEVVSYLNKKAFLQEARYAHVLKFSKFLEKILCNKVFSKIIALGALIAILLTGMLGGVMVYGASADPLSAPLLKLFGINLL